MPCWFWCGVDFCRGSFILCSGIFCVSLGDLEMVYCVTEEMVADLFTKLVMTAQDSRLTVRFYSLVPAMHPFVVSNDFNDMVRMYVFFFIQR